MDGMEGPQPPFQGGREGYVPNTKAAERATRRKRRPRGLCGSSEHGLDERWAAERVRRQRSDEKRERAGSEEGHVAGEERAMQWWQGGREDSIASDAEMAATERPHKTLSSEEAGADVPSGLAQREARCVFVLPYGSAWDAAEDHGRIPSTSIRRKRVQARTNYVEPDGKVSDGRGLRPSEPHSIRRAKTAAQGPRLELPHFDAASSGAKVVTPAVRGSSRGGGGGGW